MQIWGRKESALLDISVFFPKETQALEDPKRPLNSTCLGILASQPLGSLCLPSPKSFHHGASCQHCTSMVFTDAGL